MVDRATARKRSTWSSGEVVAGLDRGSRVVSDLLARYGQPMIWSCELPMGDRASE